MKSFRAMCNALKREDEWLEALWNETFGSEAGKSVFEGIEWDALAQDALDALTEQLEKLPFTGQATELINSVYDATPWLNQCAKNS